MEEKNLDKTSVVAGMISKRKAKKIKSQHRDYSRAFRIVIMFFKLIGFATFTIVIQKKRSPTVYMFKYSGLGIIYNAVLISLMIASNYLWIPFTLNVVYANKTNMTVGIEIIQGALGTVAICTTLLSYCVCQKSLMRIANRLVDVEHELDHLYRLSHPTLQRQRIALVLIVTCTLKVCFLIVLLITEYVAFRTNPTSWLKDIVPTFYVGWCMIQYFLIVTIVQADFTDVNRAIRNLSEMSTPDLQPQTYQIRRFVVIGNSTVHLQLLQLRGIHCDLCDISEAVSDFYSLPILFGLAFMFVTLVYNSYYFVLPLLVSHKILEFSFFINSIFWLIFPIYPIILLTTRITNISHEMKKTSNAVHSLLNCTVESETKSELEQFSLQLLHRNIKFTANGYFTLDNRLIQSMIGATMMYMVMLVQFQMGSNLSTVNSTCTQGNLSNINL